MLTTTLLIVQLNVLVTGACPDGAVRNCTLAGCAKASQVCTFPSWEPCVCDVAVGDPCNDGNACTSGDRYDAVGRCAGTPVAIDDGNSCTIDSCDLVLGVRHVPVALDDGNPCTTDTCAPATGLVTHSPALGSPCGTAGSHWCDANATCVSAPVTHVCLDDAGNITRQVTCAAGASCSPTCP